MSLTPRWLEPPPRGRGLLLNRQTVSVGMVLLFVLLTLALVSKSQSGHLRLTTEQALAELNNTEMMLEEDFPHDYSPTFIVHQLPHPKKKPEQTTDKINHAQDGHTKVVVASIGKGKEAQLDWIAEELPDWQGALYAYDGPNGLAELFASDNQTIAKNKGREANVYLTYIITHYDELPDYMVFIHGARYQPHNDDPMYDTLPEIKNLRLDYVTKNGYTPLRCIWQDGCPAPQKRPLLGHKDKFWEIAGLYAQTHQAFFPNQSIPGVVAAPCCSQFAVTREDVLKIPLERWEAMRRYLYTTHFSLPSVENMKLGIVLEYMWHIIFGKPAIFCGMPAKECYCKKFGLCDLTCPRKDHCSGRVWRAPSLRMPKGWPDKGQGRKGWPKEGWWEKSN